jgi:hypothetical protein
MVLWVSATELINFLDIGDLVDIRLNASTKRYEVTGKTNDYHPRVVAAREAKAKKETETDDTVDSTDAEVTEPIEFDWSSNHLSGKSWADF